MFVNIRKCMWEPYRRANLSNNFSIKVAVLVISSFSKHQKDSPFFCYQLQKTKSVKQIVHSTFLEELKGIFQPLHFFRLSTSLKKTENKSILFLPRLREKWELLNSMDHFGLQNIQILENCWGFQHTNYNYCKYRYGNIILNPKKKIKKEKRLQCKLNL